MNLPMTSTERKTIAAKFTAQRHTILKALRYDEQPAGCFDLDLTDMLFTMRSEGMIAETKFGWKITDAGLELFQPDRVTGRCALV